MPWTEAARLKRNPPLTDAQYKERWVQRVLANVKQDANGCWNWQGGVHTKGYAQTGYRGRTIRVHRKMYEITYGVTLPPEIFVCHSCDNRRCCNPLHLWTGTNNDNVQDMRRKRRGNAQKKTHCKRGHPLSGENLGLRGPRQHRYCKICTRARIWEKEREQAIVD